MISQTISRFEKQSGEPPMFTSPKKARNLVAGDVFRLHVYGEVLAVSQVADGKRIKVKIELENQGRRDNRELTFSGKPSGLEFTDAGYVLEFLCHPSRSFHVYSDDDWDDDDGDDIEPEPIPPHELIDA
jgi:hypothetical protein